jgi:hypothetical protein
MSDRNLTLTTSLEHIRCANDGSHFLIACSAESTDAEIGHFALPRVLDQDVGALEISMYQRCRTRVQVFHGRGDLCRHSQLEIPRNVGTLVA